MYRTLAVAVLSVSCARTLPPHAAGPDTVSMSTTNGAEPSAADIRVKQEPVLDDWVEVLGLRLHLRCEGAGAPLVVFEAGLGLDGSAWSRVQPSIARLTRTCTYDRAGRGLSGPAPYPHGQRQMATELHALLEKSAQPSPYVLVGHSMGAAIVRWFLDAHPNEVVGMVLVDPATEDWPSKVPRAPRRRTQRSPDPP